MAHIRYLRWAAPAIWLIAGAALATSSWPMWGGDDARTGYTDRAVPDTAPGIAWVRPMGASLQATPAVSPGNDRAIVPTDDGRLVWVALNTGAVDMVSSAAVATPFRGTPLVVETANPQTYDVYCGNADGRLYAVKIEHGVKVAEWHVPAAGQRPWGPIVASPVAVSFGGDHYVAVASTDGRLYLVKPADPAHPYQTWFTAGGPIEATPTLGPPVQLGGTRPIAEDMPAGQDYAILDDVTGFSLGDVVTLLDGGGTGLGTITGITLHTANPMTWKVRFTATDALDHPAGSLLRAEAKRPIQQDIAAGATTAIVADVSIFTVGDDITLDDPMTPVSLGTITALTEIAPGTWEVAFSIPAADTYVADGFLAIKPTPHRAMYVGCGDGRVYAINADVTPATQRWVYPGATTRSRGFSEPLLLHQGRLYAGDRAGVLHVLDAATGTRLASIGGNATSGPLGPLGLMHDGATTYLYAGHGGAGLARVNITDPAALPSTFTSVAVVPAAVRPQPIGDGNGHLLAPAENGALYCVKADGTLHWQWPATPRGVPLRASSVVAADGAILVATLDGYLVRLSDPAPADPPTLPAATRALPDAGAWPQHQRDAAHAGALDAPAATFTAPVALAPGGNYTASNGLRWTLNTGGAVRAATTVARMSGAIRTVTLAAQIPAPATGARGSTLIQVDDAADILHVGDPLFMPYTDANGHGQIDDLGTITAITRGANAAAPDTLEVSDGPMAAHAAGAQVQVALYRTDTVAGGQSRGYGHIGRTVPTNALAGEIWFDSTVSYSPTGGSVALYARLVPGFTDAFGAPLTTFRGAWGGQAVALGFHENDAQVTNPADAGSPVFAFLYLKDNGEIGIRRNLLPDADADALTTTVTLPPGYSLATGVEVVVYLEPNPDDPAKARLTGYYRLATLTGTVWSFPVDWAGFTRIGGATDAVALPTGRTHAGTGYLDDRLPAGVYPFLRGYDCDDAGHNYDGARRGYAVRADNVRAFIAHNPADTDANLRIGPGTAWFTTAGAGRMLPGDMLQIVDPTGTLTDVVRIADVSGAQVHIAGALTNSYPRGSRLWVGQPGRWAAFIGGDDGVLRAVDPDRGPELNANYGLWANSLNSTLGAVRGAPAVDEVHARVYVTSATGRLLAFAQQGQFLWAYPGIRLPGLEPAVTPPALDETGNVYFATADGHVYKVSPDGALVARYAAAATADRATGALALWRPAGTTADADLRVFLATKNGKVIALDGTLARQWTYPTDLTGAPAPSAFAAAPVVGGDGTVYIGDEAGRIHALYEDGNGAVQSRWRDAADDPYAYDLGTPIDVQAAIADDTLYMGDRLGRVHAITGTTDLTLTRISVALDGAVTGPLTIDAAGNLLAATARGSVYCLGPSDTWGAPRFYAGTTSIVPAATEAGDAWADTAAVFNPTTKAVTLTALLKPRFTDSAGAALTTFRATAGGQLVRVGFQDDTIENPGPPPDSLVYVYAYLTDDGKLGIRRYVNMADDVGGSPVVTLPNATTYPLVHGVQVMLTIEPPTAADPAHLVATARYRAANADGHFTGGFTLIGTYTLPTTAAGDALADALSPYLQALDTTPDAEGGFQAEAEWLSVWADSAAGTGHQAIRWQWNSQATGGMPAALPIRTAPALWHGVAIVGSDDGGVYAIGARGSAVSPRLPDQTVDQPGGVWPMYGRDARHQGGAALATPVEPGPPQPALRWFSDTQRRLAAAPLVTDATPDKAVRVYQAADDGRLLAYDASTGQLLWDVMMPAQGPVRAAPAVHSDGTIAVGALDGRLYLLRPDSVLLTPTYTPAGPAPYVGVTVEAAFPQPTYVHHVSVGTTSAGVLGVYGADGVFYEARVFAPAATADPVDVPINFVATRVVWRTDGGAVGSLATFDVYGMSAWTSLDTWTANAADATFAPGSFVVPPVRGVDGTIYAATADVLHRQADGGFYVLQTTGAILDPANAAALQDGDDATQVTTADPALAGVLGTVDYNLGVPAFVTRVRIRTANAGVLWYEADGAWTRHSNYGEAKYPRTIHVELGRRVSRLRWVSTPRTIAVPALPAIALQSFEAFVSDATLRDDGQIFLHDTAVGGPYTVKGLEARLAAATAVERVTVDTTAAGTLYVYGAGGALLASQATTGAAATLDLAAGATVTSAYWEADGAQGTVQSLKLYGPAPDHDEVAATTILRRPANPTLPYTGKTVEARFTTLTSDGVEPREAYVARVLLATRDAGTLRAFAADGSEIVAARQTVAASTILGTTELWVNRFVARLVFEAAGLTATLDDFRVYTGGGRVYAFDPNDGTVVWRSESMAPVWAPLALAAGVDTTATPRETVYAASLGGQFVALAAGDGTARWRAQQTARFTAGPVLVARPGERHDVLIPDESGILHLLAGDTGAPVTNWANGAKRVAGPVGNTPAVTAGGTAYIVTDAGLLYRIAASSATTSAPTQISDLGTQVKAAPVLDSLGRLYIGAENGELYCLRPDGVVAWRYRPDHGGVATSLIMTTTGGAYSLPVGSVTGFRVGDLAQITRPDGSLVQDLGEIRGIVEPTVTNVTLTGVTVTADNNANGTVLTLTAPPAAPIAANLVAFMPGDATGERYTVTGIAGAQITLDKPVPLMHANEPWVFTRAMAPGQRVLWLNAVSGVQVGDQVSIIPWYDPEWGTPQSLTVLGRVLAIDPIGNSIALDTDLPVASLPGGAYPAGSAVIIGSGLAYLRVTRPLREERQAGDVVRALRGQPAAMRVSPAVGPAQTVYVTAADGLLYAIGPVGPAGFPPALPVWNMQESDGIWSTFHHDNQRTGYANRPGPLSRDLRWWRGTGATLEASPVIGYADAGAPMGVLYQATADVSVARPDGTSQYQMRGSLLAVDAAYGALRWATDDAGRMGRVFGAPAVVSVRDRYSDRHVDELVIAGTTEAPGGSAPALLKGVTVLTVSGATEVRTVMVTGDIAVERDGVPQLPIPAGQPLINVGDRVLSVRVDTGQGALFSVGTEIYLTDGSVGGNYELLGSIAVRGGDTLRLAAAYRATRAHYVHAQVMTQAVHQGRVVAVDRAGAVRWVFPERGMPPIAGIHTSVAVTHASLVQDRDESQFRAYVTTDDGTIYALDFRGQLLWKYAVAPVDSLEVDLRLTAPALNEDGTRLFVGASSQTTNRGYVVALDTLATSAADRLVWKRGMVYGDVPVPGAPVPVTATPMVARLDGIERVVVVTDDFVGIGPAGARVGTLKLLNPATGDVVQSRSLRVGAAELGPVLATPAVTPADNYFEYTVTGVNLATLALNMVDGLAPGMRVRLRGDGDPVLAVITAVDTLGKTVTLEAPLGGAPVLPTRVRLLQTDEQMLIVGTLGAVAGEGYLCGLTPDLRIVWTHRMPGPIATSPAVGAEISNLVTGPIAGAGLQTAGMEVGGYYTDGSDREYRVIIDGTPGGALADTYAVSVRQWLIGGWGPWQLLAAGQPIATGWQPLVAPPNGTAAEAGLTIKFAGQTGNAGRAWQFRAFRPLRHYSAYVGANHYGTAGAPGVFQSVSFFGGFHALRWTRDMRDRLYGSPAIGVRSRGDGRALVYQACRDQFIYAFGGQFEPAGGYGPGGLPGGWPGGTPGGGTDPGSWGGGGTPGGGITPGTTIPGGGGPNTWPGPGGGPIDPGDWGFGGPIPGGDPGPGGGGLGGDPWGTDPGNPGPGGGPIPGGGGPINPNDPWGTDPNGPPNGGGTAWIPPTTRPPDGWKQGDPIPVGPQYRYVPSTVEAQKTAERSGQDPYNGNAPDERWWRFVITVKNTGNGPVGNIKLRDILPEGLIDPNVRPYVEGGGADFVTPFVFAPPYPDAAHPELQEIIIHPGPATAEPLNFNVRISEIGAGGAPDKFHWTKGGPYEPDQVIEVGKRYPLAGGVFIEFRHATGHQVGEFWDFTNRPHWEIALPAAGNGFTLWPEDQANRLQPASEHTRTIVFLAKTMPPLPSGEELRLSEVREDVANGQVVKVSDTSALRRKQRVIFRDGASEVEATINSVDVDTNEITVSPAVTVGAGWTICLDSRLRVTRANTVDVGAGGPADVPQTAPVGFSLGEKLYLHLANHPIPIDLGGWRAGYNSLFVEAQTYESNPDGTLKPPIELIAQAEAAMQSGWTTTFRVRFHYNGHMADAAGKKTFAPRGAGVLPRPFSRWNQVDPITGRPLAFVIEREFSMADLVASRSQAAGQQAVGGRPRMNTFAAQWGGAIDGDAGMDTAQSGFELPLLLDVPHFTRAGDGIGALVRSIATPYAWRAGVRQARTQINGRIPDDAWGPETYVSERVKVPGRVAEDVAAGDTATLKVTLKPGAAAAQLTGLLGHRILIVNPGADADAEAVVTAVHGTRNPPELEVRALSDDVKVGAVIRDEWAPDFVLKNPLNVQVKGQTSATVALPGLSRAGHVGVSESIDLHNTSRVDAGLGDEQFRFMATPSDMRAGTPADHNGELGGDFALGGTPPAGADWAGVRYDPYTENALALARPMLNVPAGAGLRGGDALRLYLAQRTPAYQAEGAYATPGHGVITAGGGVFIDLNGNGALDAGIDPQLDDINGNNQWDLGEPFYIETNGIPGFQVEDSGFGVDPGGLRLFVDLNGNRVWDHGEPFYVKGGADPDYGDVVTAKPFEPLVASANLVEAPAATTASALIDGGRTHVGTPYRLPLVAPLVANAGSKLLTGQSLRLATRTPLTTDNGTTASVTAKTWLTRAGSSAVVFGPTAAVTVRKTADPQPMTFGVTIPLGQHWPKTPAGGERPLGRPVAVPLTPDFRQPAGTYVGTLAVEALAGAAVASTEPVRIAVRVTETRASQVDPEATTPPAFDGATQAGIAPWTNALTGTESDPVAAPLTGAFAGDLGMWVASNTPIQTGNLAAGNLGRLLPTATTDTTIWYRRAKRLVTELTAAPNGGRLFVDPAVAARAYGAATPAADLVILRRKPEPGAETVPTLAWYGRLRSVDSAAGTLTVEALGTPLDDWAVPYADTLVEIVGQPWVPAVTQQDLNKLRASLRDPGKDGDAGPATLACGAPSVLPRGDGTFWLTFTVSAVRRVTVAGRTSVVPVSFICNKLFDPANPTNDATAISAPADLGVGAVADPAHQRDRAVMLPLDAGQHLLLFEAGAPGARGLGYAYAAQPDGAWTVGTPVGALNWAFASVGRPQVWADSVNGAAQNPVTALNCIVQGHTADGNTDLYYARLSVTKAGGAVKLGLDALDVAGMVTETLTPNAARTAFTGGKYLAWDQNVAVVVDGVARGLLVPANTWDTTREYFVEWAGGGRVGRLAVNPYTGTVRVLRGSVSTIALTGRPRLQRLTNHLAPDTNPVAVVERFRHADGGTKDYGQANTLRASPRVWLFWVRRHDDGLGPRVYYRSYRMHNEGTAAAPVIARLDAETRSEADTAVRSADMPERMLPMETLAVDGSLFVTRQATEAASAQAPEAGLWVLTTATRGQAPAYPDIATAPITGHDLFLQAVNVPVPE